MTTLWWMAKVSLPFDWAWTGSASHFALFGLVLLFLVLVSWLVGHRAILTLQGKIAANDFSTTGEEVSPLNQRLCRAHANLYENAPIWGGILLMAIATQSTSITDGLAVYFLLARLGQVVTHILSTSVIAVQIRFTFFVAQLAIAAYWLVGFAQKWFT